MSMGSDEDATEYQVVINDEEQFSIWPAERPLPAGWRAQGPRLRPRDGLPFLVPPAGLAAQRRIRVDGQADFVAVMPPVVADVMDGVLDLRRCAQFAHVIAVDEHTAS